MRPERETAKRDFSKWSGNRSARFILILKPVLVVTVRSRRTRSSAGSGTWEDVATAVENVALLSNQPRGVEHDYRVVAVNKAGAGPPHPAACGRPRREGVGPFDVRLTG